ncbi:MAG: hypothetical protein ACRDE8_11015, partial [Ginsengibacter sp.]
MNHLLNVCAATAMNSVMVNIYFNTGIQNYGNTVKNVSGVYKSNFGVGGFFGTTATLYPDSSFTFRMSGDLAYDTAAGHFQISKDFVILIYRSLAID